VTAVAQNNDFGLGVIFFMIPNGRPMISFVTRKIDDQKVVIFLELFRTVTTGTLLVHHKTLAEV
jgi:hypothetical protein